ncbi:MAG: class I SAM-dependent methyltransferase [Candidatus Brachytrichaceae bacterium NZ_4S206]|jgi:SAM-dependent methyltransferase
MAKVGLSNYGDDWAYIYDELFQDRDDLSVVSETLASLTGDGPVLEFGIGTGRLALPLAERGLKVYGIDNSEEMLKRMWAKPGADKITAIVGDCTKDSIGEAGTFSLVFIAFTTLFLLGPQDVQVECFKNAACHLRKGGVFVVEAFVHDRTRFHQFQEVVTTKIGENVVGFRVGMLDPVNQVLRTQHIELTPDGIRFRPNWLRYVYPSEMDLMARLAGMRLRERWSSWSRAPFTAESSTQIGVYEKIAD